MLADRDFDRSGDCGCDAGSLTTKRTGVAVRGPVEEQLGRGRVGVRERLDEAATRRPGGGDEYTGPLAADRNTSERHPLDCGEALVR